MPNARPPPSRDVAGEDFLFHLYRGSELLQDNRVHDAKAELEQALSLQPSDPKGQDLLGIVYFRLGLYPRAIAIYEQLIKLHPDAIEPRINLALSYLKTGQPAQARFELEKVVEQSPGHSRAWGYLGLAFQRLGDYERASYAFQAGGHDGMARRLIEMTATGGALSIRPEPPAPRRGRAAPRRRRRARRDRRGEALPRRDAGPPRAPDARDAGPRSSRPRRGRAAAAESCPSHRAAARGLVAPRPRRAGRSIAPPGSLAAHGPPHRCARRTLRPRRPGEVAREALLVFPRDLAVSLPPLGRSSWSRRRPASRRGSRRCGRSRTAVGRGERRAPAAGARPGARRAARRRRRRRWSSSAGKVELVLGPAVGHAPLADRARRRAALPARGRAHGLRVRRRLRERPAARRRRRRASRWCSSAGRATVVAVAPGASSPSIEVRRGPQHGGARAWRCSAGSAGWCPRALAAERGAGRGPRLRGVRGRGDGAPRWPLTERRARRSPRGACARTAAARSGRTRRTSPTCSPSCGC